MDPESAQSAELVLALVDECWNGKDFSRWSMWYPDDHLRHTPDGRTTTGASDIQAAIERMHTTYPGHRQTQRRLIAGGDLVFRNWAIRGEEKGRGGFPAPVVFDAVTTYRLVDGRLAEAWTTVDLNRQQMALRADRDIGDSRIHPPIIRALGEELRPESVEMARSAISLVVGGEGDPDLLRRDVVLHRSVHPPVMGAAAVAESAEMVHASFSGVGVELLPETLVWAGDHIAVAWQATGLHTGDYKDLAPTDRTMEWGGHAVVHIRGGRVGEIWLWEDLATLDSRMYRFGKRDSGGGGWNRGR